MNDKLAQYIHHHLRLVIAVVIISFLALAAGEYYLYRQIMHVNRMVSEGFMQVKEAQEMGQDNFLMEEESN